MLKPIVFSIFFLFCNLFAKADMVFDGNKRYYGKITSITSTNVTILDGCNGSPITLRWSEKSYILFSNKCTYPGYDETAASIPDLSKCKGLKLFHIKFNNGDDAYASKMRLNKNLLTIDFYASKGDFKHIELQVIGKNISNAIEWVCFKYVCTDKIPEKIPKITIEL